MEFRPELALAALGALGLLTLWYRSHSEEQLACIEAGGTFFNVSIVNAKTLEIISKQQFRTEDPEATSLKVANWLKDKEFTRIGIASFGPVELNEASPNYGSITSTPKPGWRNFPLLKTLKTHLKFRGPVGFDTDVNGAALAEFASGKHGVSASLVYITVGTGIGAGVITNGKPLRGLIHTEAGHIRVARHHRDAFIGNCPFHKDCLEGMVANGALAKRLGVDVLALSELTDDDEVWELAGFYLAQLSLSITLVLSPEVIVIGGGIMNRKVLFPIMRRHFSELLNNYLEHPRLDPEQYIRPAALADPGLLGAAYLAKLAQ
mmetsp:Transcript_13321/g.25046  ORF Transcript_13321/g.25046 Transcript_13321/m.25046 type:complete len:320 (+) Transcript_13321:1371-2330(+)